MSKDPYISLSGVTVAELIEICNTRFGSPTVAGNHYLYETPWAKDPVLSIQAEGVKAKPSQIRIVADALMKLEADDEKH